jgi:hypothetical protein
MAIFPNYQTNLLPPSGFSNGINIGHAYSINANNGVKGTTIAPVHNYIITPVAGGTVVNGATTVLANTAFTILTNTTITGVSNTGDAVAVFQFDVPRNISLAIGVNSNTTTISVLGYDYIGNFMREDIAVTGGAGAQTVNGVKSFAAVSRIVNNSGTATGTTYTITGGLVFGLDQVCPGSAYFLQAQYNNSTSGVSFVAPILTTSTATTADVRGTVSIPSITANASLVVFYAPIGALTPNTGAAPGNNYSTALYGIAQYSVFV